MSAKRLFPNPYQEFIYKSRYARYIDGEKRREDLPETVNRYLDFMQSHLNAKHGYWMPEDLRADLFNHICQMDNMPSMRAMMTAGEALARDNTAGFNCSYLPVQSAIDFDEAMFILLCGTGVGFSVESRYVSQLPAVPELLIPTDNVIVVQDSKEGWGLAYRELLAYLWEGIIPRWNTDAVRPAGTRLKTFGGRASGPGPLVELFEFTIKTFIAARGRQLRPIECHDIMCKIGDIVVVGGVRRSAMISLSDLHDEALAGAKGFFKVESFTQTDDWGYAYRVNVVNAYGEIEPHDISFKLDGSQDWDITQMKEKGTIGWWHPYPHRQLSNNSAVYEARPDAGTFLGEWTALVKSGSGERGIFSRAASQVQAAKKGLRSSTILYGTNPCSEIILRPYQMCNLTSTMVRATDTLDDLCRKVTMATVLGTYQSTLTNFPYLRDIWRQNTEEERLLGVSLTGIMDHPVLNGSQGEDMRDAWLIVLNEQAEFVNRVIAEAIGINPSAAITAIKPEGTTSQMTDTASGIHARHADYYLRSVRQDNKDPVTAFLKAMGVPNEPCVRKGDTTTIFYFPQKAPEGAVTRNDMTAIEQLENWLAYQRFYCDHKPSCTVSVRDEEWMDVGRWVYEHFDELSGISFLPHSDHVYAQAPYQDLTAAEYAQWVAKSPTEIDWGRLAEFEQEDMTTSSQTLACVAGNCEI